MQDPYCTLEAVCERWTVCTKKFFPRWRTYCPVADRHEERLRVQELERLDTLEWGALAHARPSWPPNRMDGLPPHPVHTEPAQGPADRLAYMPQGLLNRHRLDWAPGARVLRGSDREGRAVYYVPLVGGRNYLLSDADLAACPEIEHSFAEEPPDDQST